MKLHRTIVSLRTIKYCCFVACWSFLLVTTVYIVGDSGSYLEDVSPSQDERKEELKPRFDDLELLIDQKRRDKFVDMVRAVEQRIPSLPLDFWARQTQVGRRKMEAQCGQFPSIFDLNYSNDYWQTQKTDNATLQLFGAYFDNRKTIPDGEVFIRVLGMIDRVNMNDKMFCQIWYDKIDESFIVPVDNYNYIWMSDWGNAIDGQYQPYLISCRIPEVMRQRIPSSVSLVGKQCDLATNNLRVIYNRPISEDMRKSFGVCVKGLDFMYDDLSVRLVEWIELLRILGADKIFFYELQVHPNISRVLDFYVRLGVVEVTKLTLPAGKPNIPGLQHMYLSQRINQKRQHELIPYNDCLYKNMYRYEYLTLLDIDEVIMPKGDHMNGWSDMMKVIRGKAELTKEFYPSYNFRNIYFLESFYETKRAQFNAEIPSFLHMLRHTTRAQLFSNSSDHAKCFHRSDYILTLHNHFALNCIHGYCYTYDTETEDAQLQHYRQDCDISEPSTCANMIETLVEDKTIYKYKNKLIRRSLKTLFHLGFLKVKQQQQQSTAATTRFTNS